MNTSFISSVKCAVVFNAVWLNLYHRDNGQDKSVCLPQNNLAVGGITVIKLSLILPPCH